MFTARDLAARFGVTLHDIAEWNLYKVLPGPVRINSDTNPRGFELRWREEDIELFIVYLEAMIEHEDNGNEAYGADAPAPPVYSTGRPACDPREVVAREKERERRERSKTLSASAATSPAELPAKMPSPPGAAKVQD